MTRHQEAVQFEFYKFTKDMSMVPDKRKPKQLDQMRALMGVMQRKSQEILQIDT